MATKGKGGAKGKGATATKAAPAKADPATKAGVTAVLKRLAKDHPGWGDAYKAMLPAEKSRLHGELAGVFDAARAKAAAG